MNMMKIINYCRHVVRLSVKGERPIHLTPFSGFSRLIICSLVMAFMAGGMGCFLQPFEVRGTRTRALADALYERALKCADEHQIREAGTFTDCSPGLASYGDAGKRRALYAGATEAGAIAAAQYNVASCCASKIEEILEANKKSPGNKEARIAWDKRNIALSHYLKLAGDAAAKAALACPSTDDAIQQKNDEEDSNDKEDLKDEEEVEEEGGYLPGLPVNGTNASVELDQVFPQAGLNPFDPVNPTNETTSSSSSTTSTSSSSSTTGIYTGSFTKTTDPSSIEDEFKLLVSNPHSITVTNSTVTSGTTPFFIGNGTVDGNPATGTVSNESFTSTSGTFTYVVFVSAPGPNDSATYTFSGVK